MPVVDLVGFLDDKLAVEVTAKLLYFEHRNPNQTVRLRISSPGGSVTAGLAVIATVQGLRVRVASRALEQASGVAAIILAVGAKGMRSARPSTRISFAPAVSFPPSGAEAMIQRLNCEQARILARVMRLPEDRALELLLSRRSVSAAQASELGLIDRVARFPFSWHAV